jgi:WD40 repeat protein
MSADCAHVICSSQDGEIFSLDPLTGSVLRRTSAHRLQLTCLNFSHDGRFFVTGGGDGKAILWDTNTLDKLMEFRGNAAQEIPSADVSPDGARVVTCNRTGAWQIWDSRTGEQLTEIRASNLPLNSIVFSSDGKTLMTAGEDGYVRAWKALDEDPTVRIALPRGAAQELAK